MLTWDLLTELFDYEFLRSHPSIIHQSINTFLLNTELYCVKISALKFLNKVCQQLMESCDNTDLEDVQGDEVTVGSLLQTLNRKGLISQIHKLLSAKDCPLLFLTLTLQLLHRLTQMDYKKAVPVLTQLDYWSFLVELLDIQTLAEIERHESRQSLQEMKRAGILNYRNPLETLDLVYMALNAVMDFLFEAMKRDSQLAGLLVKTTKMMQRVLSLIKHTLDCYRRDSTENTRTLRIQNKGLLTVFSDKALKILHLALLHPQDYSVDLISKFVFEQPLNQEKDAPLPRNWLYFIDMFAIMEKFSQSFDCVDVKLALIRFISELLIQTAHFKTTFLDELVYLKCDVIHAPQNSNPVFYEADLDTYGSKLFMEFAKVFKALYVDNHGSRYESENQKRDIALCLQVLLASSQSAKRLAVEQNFLKKVIDICAENASAMYLAELQKYSGKGPKRQLSQQVYEQQLQRTFKHVSPDQDQDECEREVVRMLQLIRHVFFDSDTLLQSLVDLADSSSVMPS